MNTTNKKLSPAQEAFLADLNSNPNKESRPAWGQPDSGRQASAWHRTAKSLQDRGLVRVLRGAGYKAVLA